jgi:GNAT superfamily N-acetyltransferase
VTAPPPSSVHPAPPPQSGVRPAAPGDVPAIYAMIVELADYERLRHLVVATETDLATALFGPRATAEVLVSCKDRIPVAFALYFHNFSTFLGRRGLWLEDLFVRPAYRRQGRAKALLEALAGVAIGRGCGRFEWAVLDWNAPAIDFYRGLGAEVLDDWRLMRLSGDSLQKL